MSERRQEIQKRLTRTIPASAQRVEITEEITNIKRQSLVEDKIAEVEQKSTPIQETVTTSTTTTTTKGKVTTTTTTTTTVLPSEKKTISEIVEVQKTTIPSDKIPQISEMEKVTTTTTTTTTNEILEEKPDAKKTTVTTVVTKTSEKLPDDITAHNVIDKRDTDLLQSVSEKLETDKRIAPRLIAQESGEFFFWF